MNHDFIAFVQRDTLVMIGLTVLFLFSWLVLWLIFSGFLFTKMKQKKHSLKVVIICFSITLAFTLCFFLYFKSDGIRLIDYYNVFVRKENPKQVECTINKVAESSLWCNSLEYQSDFLYGESRTNAIKSFRDGIPVILTVLPRSQTVVAIDVVDHHQYKETGLSEPNNEISKVRKLIQHEFPSIKVTVLHYLIRFIVLYGIVAVLLIFAYFLSRRFIKKELSISSKFLLYSFFIFFFSYGLISISNFVKDYQGVAKEGVDYLDVKQCILKNFYNKGFYHSRYSLVCLDNLENSKIRYYRVPIFFQGLSYDDYNACIGHKLFIISLPKTKKVLKIEGDCLN